MHITSDVSKLSAIVDDLASQGWSQQADFLPAELVSALAAECRRRAGDGQLNPAGVGRGGTLEVREAIRGDHIRWLEPGESSACDRYLDTMDALRQAINQGLFIGLEDYECHFALYPPGAFYRRHLDRFRDDDRRAVSAVIYLNQDWQPGDGGELRMFLDDQRVHDVAPTAGTLVVFLSGDVPHEVLAAGRERLSLTGWFRRRGNEPF
ncbi:2OG-Fe(II) oxygenase [Pseudomonas shirazensis]|jgi:SM-20-related protein|uniref:Fe2OG dioxygenase domain-containing protein n=2 Tax=Pseudomonas TaxID=286 RepID=A0A5E6SY05_PSEFL|nr:MULTISPECIES: 2OG-Fe(II) oxygenase [Pseudomonas]AUF94373.1 2OG-Fe(II) oxygenase [Pseudomonas sp. 02C 26]MBA1197116.1 2OG-Fe(II) oxygenase [Pseudomonas plecoglossicida]MCS4283890.1 SM-20-related protein [Pseudomonas sp. BIGb0278]QYX52021.1 2OG-Fe(II) oxygenase [Pseudomonas sp. S07E 245]RZI90583.1 MAG: 2OG-Fe(II) oxygenase [Pseudomonas sp.]